MTIEEMKKYNDATFADLDDIARALRDYIDAPPESIGSLIDAIGWLEAAAQNPYNHDYFRVLYNALIMFAERT